MKREPAPTLEQVAEIIRHVDLSKLSNRLAGKPLIEFEHCLIEVLGALMDDQRLHLDVVSRLAQDCIDTSSRSEFLSAYSDYSNEKSMHFQKHANFSPVGRYFYKLLDRLNDMEEKQIHNNKTVTVSHARSLAAIIVRQLEIMTSASEYRNEKLEKMWDHWVNQPITSAM